MDDGRKSLDSMSQTVFGCEAIDGRAFVAGFYVYLVGVDYRGLLL